MKIFLNVKRMYFKLNFKIKKKHYWNKEVNIDNIINLEIKKT